MEDIFFEQEKKKKVLPQDVLSHYDEDSCVYKAFFCGCLGCEGYTHKLFCYAENPINFRIEI